MVVVALHASVKKVMWIIKLSKTLMLLLIETNVQYLLPQFHYSSLLFHYLQGGLCGHERQLVDLNIKVLSPYILLRTNL